jgi:hypothetical protein
MRRNQYRVSRASLSDTNVFAMKSGLVWPAAASSRVRTDAGACPEQLLEQVTRRGPRIRNGIAEIDHAAGKCKCALLDVVSVLGHIGENEGLAGRRANDENRGPPLFSEPDSSS